MSRILILTPQLPYPPHQGTSLRNFHIMRGLAARHELTLLSFVEENQSTDPQAIAPLLALCTHMETVPVPRRGKGKRLQQLLTTTQPDMAHRLFSPVLNLVLRRLLTERHFDIVQIEGIEMARTMDIVRQASPHSRIVFDDHNAESELQRRNMLTDLRQPRRWVAAAYSWMQVGRLRRFEGWACRQADAVTVVSGADKIHLAQLLLPPAPPITVIPNCIDVPSLAQAAPEEAPAIHFDLVFTGKMDYRPNVDAVLWFADEVWPRIQRARPHTTWAIVGQKPHARLQRLLHVSGVTVTGWVDSVRPYLAGAAVFIMPFRVGSGTRLKLAEAMAAGKAVVSTHIGAEGYPVQDGRDLLLADTVPEMETAVLQLLEDEQQRMRLGVAAREFAAAYDWRVVIPAFNQVYAQILEN